VDASHAGRSDAIDEHDAGRAAGTPVAPGAGMMRLHDLAELLEGALSAARMHEADRACELMREVIRCASTLPPDAIVGGPLELQAGFYLNSARAFLHIHDDLAIEESGIRQRQPL